MSNSQPTALLFLAAWIFSYMIVIEPIMRRWLSKRFGARWERIPGKVTRPYMRIIVDGDAANKKVQRVHGIYIGVTVLWFVAGILIMSRLLINLRF